MQKPDRLYTFSPYLKALNANKEKYLTGLL